MKTPLILVLPDIQESNENSMLFLRRNYTTAIIAQGGAPFIVPYNLDLLSIYMDIAQGLLITGGGFTIDPELFNQPMRCTLPLKPERTQLEWSYCQAALDRKMPILGICGGMQLINVVLGGSLIQDLSQTENTIPHQVPGVQDAHTIRILPDTLLSRHIQQETLSINSSHQQSVDRLGQDVHMNALASDGVVEGIEYVQHPFCIGVQWHPEYSDQDHSVLAAFVKACGEFQN